MKSCDLTGAQEQLMLRAREVIQKEIKPKVRDIAKCGEYPFEVRDILQREGFLGIFFPKEYGGGGQGVLEFSLVAEELGAVDVACANLVVNQGLGSYPIAIGGSKEQKEKYLPKLASGEYIAAFSLTEPGGGSDVANIQTRAVPDGDAYVVTGTKCYCSQGNVAHMIALFAVTNPEAKMQGLSGFILDGGTPGYVVGKLENKMGVKASPTAELIFDGCRINKNQLIGKENGGFMLAMKTLDKSRPVVGAMCVGVARAAMEECIRYCSEKIVNGKPLAQQQGVTLAIGEMATQVELARLIVRRAALETDMGGRQSNKLGSMSKLYPSDVCMRVTTEALRIMGADGYSEKHMVEHHYRDAKLTQIVEGTNQIQRLVIAREILKEVMG